MHWGEKIDRIMRVDGIVTFSLYRDKLGACTFRVLSDAGNIVTAGIGKNEDQAIKDAIHKRPELFGELL